MPEGIIQVEIDNLKPHPENINIYGDDEDVSDLMDQIKAMGRIIDPLRIKDDGTIISGHRRWKAAMELGYATVPCEYVSFNTPEEELAALILFNRKRTKTNEQKAREGIALFTTLSEEAVKRRLAKLIQNSSVMDAGTTTGTDTKISSDSESDSKEDIGLTRDKVAQAVGITSGRTFDRMREVVNKIDELRNTGNTDDSELYIAVLNKKPTAARELLKVPLESLTNDNRSDIMNGKVAPRKFIPKNITSDNADQDEDKKTPYKKTTDELGKVKRAIEAIDESIEYINRRDSQERICSLINESINKLYKTKNSITNKNLLSEDLSLILNEYSDLTILLKEYFSRMSYSVRMEELKNAVETDSAKLQELLSEVETELERIKEKEKQKQESEQELAASA